MTVVVNTTVFRNFMPCSVVRKYQRFGKTCCIILRVEELFFYSKYEGKRTFPILKIETSQSAEMWAPSNRVHTDRRQSPLH